MKKIIFILVVFFFCTSVFLVGQNDTIKSINLGEVEILESRPKFFNDDKNVTVIDSLALANNKENSLTELLTNNTAIYINNYGGSGAMSSISFRGTSSDHTSVMWNGFPINSLTIGGADLSTIPVAVADDISLVHGASATYGGSGTFGGVIELNNKPDWKNKCNVISNSKFGSFNDKRNSLKIKLGSKKIQFYTNAFIMDAINDFEYVDTYKFGSPLVKMENNAFKNRGLINNVFYKLDNNNRIDGGIWCQEKSKEIPQLMGAYGNSNQFQEDKTLKSYISWNRYFSKSKLTIKSAYIYDYLRYTDKTNEDAEDYLIDSKMISKRLLNDLNYINYVSNVLSLDMSALYNYKTAEVTEYNGDIFENHLAIIAACKMKYSKIIYNFSLRKDYITNTNPKPLLSAGIKYNLIPERLVLRLNYSDKFRVADFNDKYWYPGGDPSLKPESGWGGDFGVDGVILSGINTKSKIITNISFYTSLINNYIQWVPSKTNMSLWQPLSYKSVRSKGIEYMAQHVYTSKKLKIKHQLNYTYTNAVNIAVINEEKKLIDKELRYVPNHQLKFNGKIIIRDFLFGYNIGYVGERYTDDDNNQYLSLPYYVVLNSFFGGKIKLNETSGEIMFGIENILDYQYQVMKAYAMPGKSYYISLTLNINYSTK